MTSVAWDLDWPASRKGEVSASFFLCIYLPIMCLIKCMQGHLMCFLIRKL
jgi:hypothetical protein